LNHLQGEKLREIYSFNNPGTIPTEGYPGDRGKAPKASQFVRPDFIIYKNQELEISVWFLLRDHQKRITGQIFQTLRKYLCWKQCMQQETGQLFIAIIKVP
jgi:hypothetical protein